MARILVPLPDRDFDLTETAVPWKLLTEAGCEVTFATERADKPACDPRLIGGVLFGQMGAKETPIAFYRELENAPAFERPISWKDIEPASFDALLLPGGHAQGMRQYLGSELLQSRVAAFAKTNKPIAAICHGVLVLARAKDPSTGKSILHGRRTTCLPKYMEQTAYYLTAWKLGRYYRTYEAWVEDEVKAALGDPSLFERGPTHLMAHGTRDDDRNAFVVEDSNYVSGRWPGDAFLLAKRLLAVLQ